MEGKENNMTSATEPRPATLVEKRRARSELREWQAKYINYLRLIGSESTASRYDQALDKFFGKFKNALRPSDILRPQVEDYKLLRKGEGIKNGTINLEISAGKGLYDFIIRMSELPIINPFAGGRRLREEERPKRAMALRYVEKIFEVSTGPEILLATLAFTTGMRGEEMVLIEKKHFDLENSRVILPPEIVKGKKKGRTLPVRDDLKALVAALPDGRLFQGWADSWPQLNKHWRRLLWKAEVPAVGLHSTRHTYATRMLRNGADIATVRDLMGHASIKTTGGYLTGEDADTAKAFLTAIPGKQTMEGRSV
jgi:integrase/recombinase XerD